MSNVNSKLSQNVLGIVIPTDYAGAATNKAAIQLLIDLISKEGMDGGSDATRQARLYLDEMSPMCRDVLYAHLTALYAAVENAA